MPDPAFSSNRSVQLHPLQVMTVSGPVDPGSMGLVDAHAHIWIEQMPETAPGLPVLDDHSAIAAELKDYRLAGGGGMIDCQPGGCGRNGKALVQLAAESGIHIVACTGFHLRKYYPPDAWIWKQSAQVAGDYFIKDLTQGMEECQESETPVLAGFIKLACESTLARSPAALLEAAIIASRSTDAAIEIHTEKGEDVEAIINYFLKRGSKPGRLVICHIDKCPDYGLHRSLAEGGLLLEYDTFYRSKYEPEKHLWPLIEQMASAGLSGSVALATDMAESNQWRHYGGSPGLAGALIQIRSRLESLGCNERSIRAMMGGNISQRLARFTTPPV
jgi:5-phospho-D-xylono-1,4-lactonase